MGSVRLYKGLVTHVIDPSNFWMRIGTDDDMNMFEDYQQRLNDFYNEDRTKYTCDINDMFPNYLVVVDQFIVTESNQTVCDGRISWERAQVTRIDIDNKTADVFFVDLGFSSIVSVDDCRDIPEKLFNFLPPQARRASLDGIKPLSKSWTSRASDPLQSLTSGQEVLTLPTYYDEASGSCYVVIYTRHPSGEWESLIHAMQHEDLALVTDDSIEKFLTDDVAKQCLYGAEDHSNDQKEVALPADFHDEAEEQWDDGHWSPEVIDEVQLNRSACEEISTNKYSAVTGFDYGILDKSRMLSISKMQQDIGLMTQEHTKAKLKRGLDRLDSMELNHDDQDWEAAQDIGDSHIDIKSQIYHGVERQTSDEGMLELWSRGNIISSVESKPKELERPVNQLRMQEEIEEATVREDVDADKVPLNEVECYRLEKQIKEILRNKEERESDFICASVYSVVEPDMDVRSDLLQVVICAILEHTLANSCQQSEVAFAILESYSDADAFCDAMIHVVTDMRYRFVRKTSKSKELSNTHKEFAKLLSSLFRQADDWNERVCQTVQDKVMSLVEMWIVFNRQRNVTGSELVESELIYVESAGTFLTNCHQLVKSRYAAKLASMMEEIRWKLVKDGTTSSIRDYLLDLYLSLSSGEVIRAVTTTTTSIATQTDQTSDNAEQTGKQSSKDKQDAPITEGQETPITERQDTPSTEEQEACTTEEKKAAREEQEAPTNTTSPTDTTNMSDQLGGQSKYCSKVADADTNISLLRKRKVPKSIKNLPERFIRKYLQDTKSADPCSSTLVSSSSCENPETAQPRQTLSNIKNTLTVIESSSGPEVYYQPSTTVHSKSVLPPSKKSSSDDVSAVSSCQSTTPDNSANNPHSHQKLSNLSFSNEPVLNMNMSGGLSSIEPPVVDMCTDSTDLQSTAQSSQHKQFTNAGNLDILGCIEGESVTRQDDDIDVNESIAVHPDRQTNEGGSVDSRRIIRYTPKRLMDLNPFKDQPKLPLWDLWEPKEVLDQMIVMVNPGRSDLHERYPRTNRLASDDLNWRLNPGADEFKPSPGLDKEAFKVNMSIQGSSVDPDPSLEESNSDNIHNVYSDYKNVNNSINENDCVVGTTKLTTREDNNNKPSPGSQDIAESLVGSKVEEDTEMWHDDSFGPKGDFLRSTKKENVPSLSSKKLKKKRGKGIPFDQYIQERANLQVLAEGDGEEDSDYLSPEALQMYEELDKMGVGEEDVEQDGLYVLKPAKVGSHIVTSSKRLSLFASVRNQPSVVAAQKPWCPTGKRFCTRCGSSDHVVYACREQASRFL